MPLFAIANLSSLEVTPCQPWEFKETPPPEVKGKKGKTARSEWIQSPGLRWQVYSGFEGVNPSGRIVKEKGPDEGNPPFRLHAFVADIDCPLSDEELGAGLGRMKFLPAYFERTLSGNVRCIWLLEKPVALPNRRFAEEYLAFVVSRLHPDQIGPGFDAPAWKDPARYYTNSGEWYEVDANARVPADLTDGWLVEVSEKHLWKKDRGAVDIPLPIVFEEIRRKWPQLEWPGDFTEGSQGPTFWVEGSTSPKSAVVKPTGLYTFSQHAPKPFYNWADLLGRAFVDDHVSRSLGKAVEGIYHDGKLYFRKDGNGRWRSFSKEDIALHLTTDRGLSAVKDTANDCPSEVNRAISYIHNWHGIDGAAPFVFQPSGVIARNGGTFLNTFTRKVCQPSAEPGVWGPKGNFPFLSQVLDNLFHPDSVPARPLDYWLSWLSRFYTGAYHNSLESGQAVFLLGGAGIGKTFLSQGLIPHLLGGGVSAESYLMGETTFNSELFECAFWTIDDNAVTGDRSAHRIFSALVKKMAANTAFQQHQKFRIPVTVDWTGRVFVTANSDEQSIQIVPNLSITILDKLSLYLGNNSPKTVFPSLAECKRIIHREAPYFARFLLDYEIPAHLRGSSRFGVLPYHEATLLKSSDQSSETAAFREVLEHWRAAYFEENRSDDQWRGTSFQLAVQFSKDPAFLAATKGLTHVTINRQLTALKAAGVAYLECNGDGSTRVWTVHRADVPPAPATPVQKAGSKFAKTS